MKLFGQYLVDKGVISKSDLVRALIIQLENTPSVTSVILENDLLTTDQLYQIFQLQADHKSGFIEAARELGCWGTKIQEQVEKILSSKRKPIGEILVKLGATEISNISKALDEFLGELGSAPAPVAVAAPVETLETEVEDILSEIQAIEETIEAPVEESESGLNSDVVTYCEKFSLDTFLEATSLLSFDQAGVFTSERVKEAVELLHSLKGTARFAQLVRSEAVINSMENSLNTVLKVGVEKVTPPLVIKLESHSKRNLDLLWNLREDISAGMSEAQSLESRNLVGAFRQLTGQEI
jgi:HPt (histidine-containing phosphotransfer) domain-containing protein